MEDIFSFSAKPHRGDIILSKSTAKKPNSLGVTFLCQSPLQKNQTMGLTFLYQIQRKKP